MEILEPVFLMQMIVSLTTLGFSMYMLIEGQGPGTYLPIVTAIVGYWIPSPVSTKKTLGLSEPAALPPPV